MKSVWKYGIPEKDRFSIEMPARAEILAVQIQNEKAQLWVLVDPDKRLTKRDFLLVGTGEPIDESLGSLKYIGTLQSVDGSFVGHIFEIKTE